LGKTHETLLIPSTFNWKKIALIRICSGSGSFGG